MTDQVLNIMAEACFAAKRHELKKRLSALDEHVASVRAFNSLGPSLSESFEIYGDLTAAQDLIRAALARLRAE